MKDWVWIVVCVIIGVTIGSFGLPLWMYIVFVCPVFVIILTYASIVYSFKAALELKLIPEKGYESRIKDLQIEETVIGVLDFVKIDEFYLKMIPDSIIYVFKHKFEPIYLDISHFGTKKGYDLVTIFEKDISITTSANIECGLIPRPSNRLLQIFENLPIGELLDKHRMAVDFLKKNGIKEVDIPLEMFRERFMNSMREIISRVRRLPFWPVRVIYWTVIRRGKIYLKSIEEQQIRNDKLLINLR